MILPRLESVLSHARKTTMCPGRVGKSMRLYVEAWQYLDIYHDNDGIYRDK